MTQNSNLKNRFPRFSAKTLWTPVALAGWLAVANCSTLGTTQVADNDLANLRMTLSSTFEDLQ